MTNNAEQSGSWPCSSSTTCECERAEVDRVGCDRLRGAPGQLQQRIDHAVHARGRRCDPVHVIMRDPIERVAEVFLQQPGEAASTTREGSRRSCDTDALKD